MSLFTRIARGRQSAAGLARSFATVTEAAGVKVAGIERGAPSGTVNLTVVVKAGARYEPAPGVAHVLKNFAFKSTASGSALKLARETELYGGVLSAALGRENLYLTAEFLKGDEAHFLSVLASVLSSTQYLPHEYAELVLPTIQSESITARADPSTLSLDLAHLLAFRRGLGNSLFATPVSPVSLNDVKSYAQQAYAKSNIAVIGAGLSTEALSKAVSSAFGGNAGSSSGLTHSASQYFGGEQRVELDLHANPTARPTLTLAFGSTGAASEDLKVLPHLLGGASSVKWNSGTSPLSLIADKVAGAKIETALLPYSDASLLTVTVSAPTSEGVKSLAKEVAAAVQEASKASAEDVKKAVAKAKVAEATKYENVAGLISTVSSSIFSGEVATAQASLAALDKVSTSSLHKASASLFKAKPTVVAVGDLGVLPYADEIGL